MSIQLKNGYDFLRATAAISMYTPNIQYLVNKANNQIDFPGGIVDENLVINMLQANNIISVPITTSILTKHLKNTVQVGRTKAQKQDIAQKAQIQISNSMTALHRTSIHMGKIQRIRSLIDPIILKLYNKNQLILNKDIYENARNYGTGVKYVNSLVVINQIMTTLQNAGLNFRYNINETDDGYGSGSVIIQILF